VSESGRPRRDKPIEPPSEWLETANRRQLPDFVIIGTQRGGTTSLYRYLAHHADVGPALRKEVHFFDLNYDRGVDWYRAHFPEQGQYQVVGEASPYYVAHPDVPARIHQVLPHALLILLLRNPIDRALSHYQLMVRRGLEPLSFQEAVEREPERLRDSGGVESPSWRNYSYLARGVYAPQIERWLGLFPASQLLVIKSEDFYHDPGAVVIDVQTRLGLAPSRPDRMKAHHLSEYPQMDDALRRRLRDYFVPFNQQLYALLGRDLRWEHE
jgi:hypothetical protein